jgi:hypothetical protein
LKPGTSGSMSVAMVQQPVAFVRAKAAIERRSAFDDEVVTVPSTAVRAYLRSFQLVALVCSGGRISVSRDPFRPMGGRIEAVWWVASAAQALEVMQQCEREESLDVYNVAQGLGIGLTPNNVAIANAERAVACLDARMAAAQDAGLLKALNHRYRVARMAARQRGQSFPPYQIVHRRFTQLLYRIAAGEVPTRSLVEEALDLPQEATQPSAPIRW